MKTHLSKCVAFLFLIVLSISFSCNRENNISPDPDNGPLVQTNGTEYSKLLAGREDFDGTPFEITKVTREGNSLKIDVTGGGGIENYKVVWDGQLMLSYPMQARLVVAYDTPDGAQDAAMHDYTLEVDLQKLFGNSANASEVIVHLANGSKKQDKVVDPNGSTSNPK
ncbi:hypothetical protein J2Y45_004141 [Dyadobacter sp. BE34]|uniref:DUF4906 domain-containing protein n=1 Tax=Dyadobacter fermentans TaxID=94254 RepID=A0ABU1R1Z8_9BACT|nr:MULTISPECIES: hypothetical protein [Dyadobacter]MDR6806949.1 hypothetical protein [Dyadobacter fermentans]MDR7044691.1 hypothetical protein [Dyadobacter sp. BE242]MDR7199001.1 hypothetical protein [Dyadobacter sp. BE34]MDR7216963.1 hypothetical protein [Dyadobacter sp. BE31]MDR7263511.1 hypothetical protein [Dyadobacter sp. BE32]